MKILDSESQKKYDKIILVLSIVIPVAVALLFGIRTKIDLGSWTKILPHFNAVLNTMTALLLLIGVVLVKRKDYVRHEWVMKAAFGMGSLFLVFYVLYHLTNSATTFGGEGWIRACYYTLLISHIILAGIVVPFVLYSVYYGQTNQREKHRKIVKWAFPIWLYVSVTGVIVYLMIAPYYV